MRGSPISFMLHRSQHHPKGNINGIAHVITEFGTAVMEHIVEYHKGEPNLEHAELDCTGYK